MNVGRIKLVYHRPVEGRHAQDRHYSAEQHGQVVRHLLV